jgi:hypothetical protein
MFYLTPSQLLLIGLGFVVCCYIFPQLAIWVFHSTLTGKDKVEAIDAYRKTLAQVIGGLALVGTFGWTLYKDRETLDQGKAQLANQQFVEGAKLLKDDGGTSAAGAHALGRVAITQPEFQWAVVTTLVSFIKSKKDIKSETQGGNQGAPGAVPANIQAALSVIASRDQSRDEQVTPANEICRSSLFRIDLFGAYLVRARFANIRSTTAFAT